MTATALKLWELGDALAGLIDELIENGGELTPDLQAQLEVLEPAFERKVERVLLYAKNLEAQAAVASAEASRLASLADGRTKAARRLKDYVLLEMERVQRPKIETELIRARIQQNSRPAITWTGATDALPEGFQRVTVALDGTKAYEAWKAGQSLPAGFDVQLGRHLRVS